MPWTKPYRPAQNQRLDPEQYTVAGRVYFMTLRAYQHHSPFAHSELAQLIIDVLHDEQDRQHCLVFTYCLMPDHLHFLLGPRREDISVLDFVNEFKGKTTNRSWKMGWAGKLWQPRFFDHIVRDEEDLLAISKYIVNNPVRKGLVQRPEDWPWSGHMNPVPI